LLSRPFAPSEQATSFNDVEATSYVMSYETVTVAAMAWVAAARMQMGANEHFMTRTMKMG
jgi:hypothetical protein